MTILVIGCSLNGTSNSQILAGEAVKHLQQIQVEASLLDLRKHSLSFCSGENEDAMLAELARRVREADAIIMAVPIYNYDVNAAAKNLVEHVGKAFENKLVAFMCASGGQNSYMSVMSLANSLMLDFRCLVVPRFVYATSQAFDDGRIINEQIAIRVKELCNEVVRLTKALKVS